jgi:hypothetical protein
VVGDGRVEGARLGCRQSKATRIVQRSQSALAPTIKGGEVSRSELESGSSGASACGASLWLCRYRGPGVSFLDANATRFQKVRMELVVSWPWL